MRASRIAVCHHDLWHHNLLRSEAGRLSGVLDMAHLEVTDPAHDFAAPRHFGDAVTIELIAAYRAAVRRSSLCGEPERSCGGDARCSRVILCRRACSR